MDCIYDTLSQKLPLITAKDIFRCNGISNGLVSFKYANEWFNIVEGRGTGNPVELLEMLQIPFSISSIEELFECIDIENIIIFLPRDLLKHYMEINISYKQLLFFYSAFYVEKIDNQRVILKITYDDTRYVLHKDEIQRISTISTFPLEKSIYIVKLKDASYEIDKSYSKQNLLDRINIFLGHDIVKDESRIKISGVNMYDALVNIINYPMRCWNKTEKIRQNFFIASLNAGTVGLYRYEFANAIADIPSINQSDICEKLKRSASAWREIGYRLAFFQESNIPIDDDCRKYIAPIIEDIKELELTSMRDLREYLRGDIKI